MTVKLVAAVAVMLPMLAAGASMCDLGTYDLNTVPFTAMNVTQRIATNNNDTNTTTTMYGWAFSLCAATTAAPRGWASCIDRSYVAQFSNDQCMTGFSHLAGIFGAWTLEGDKAVAQFSSFDERANRQNVANVTVECGPTLALQPKGADFPLNITTTPDGTNGFFSVFTHIFELTSSVMCPAARRRASGL